MLKKSAIYGLVLLLCLGALPGKVFAASTSVMIVGLQTGSVNSASEEFVELYNQSGQTIDVTDWSITYSSSTESSTPKLVAKLNGTISPHGYLLVTSPTYKAPTGVIPQFTFSYSQGISSTGGHIRLLDSGSNEIDKIGYGTAINPELTAAAAPGADQVLMRCTDTADIFNDTDNNSQDFLSGTGALFGPGPVCTRFVVKVQDTPGPIVAPAATECVGVQLSELLPNPAGSDTAGEYIELYNPTSQAVSLKGCSLRLGTNGKQYAFGVSDVLNAKEYKAFDYSVTGLQLTNGGGEVWLITNAEETSITYPLSGDDMAWAYIGNNWSVTYEPTPSAANVLYLSASGLSTTSADSPGTVCPEGKYLNPDTNRCKNIVAGDTELTSCKAGQERNPETNRCRAVAIAAVASLVPCREGYERNEETNRCRKVDVIDSSALKPCGDGEERNPETNRCRKSGNVAGVASAAGNAKDAINKSSQNYRILIIVLMLAGTYGIYEYRHDFGNAFVRIRERFGKKSR